MVSQDDSSQNQTMEGDAETDDAFVDIAKNLSLQDPLPLSDRETEVLDLYDQLEDLKLTRALLEAEAAHDKDQPLDISDQEVEVQLKDAERQCLDARAGYLLKNSIVANVVQADPLLKAVHSGTNANALERALHPLVDQRDILAMVQANLSNRLQSTSNAMTETETENLKAMRTNRELAAALLGLAGRLKSQDISSISDAETRLELESMKQETKESKRQYRIMKSLIGAVIAGSGVDWATDDELRELVLDREEE